jgi:hypothetical protein
MKDDNLEPHHGDKSPKHRETITPFTLKSIPTTNNKLHETNFLQQIPKIYSPFNFDFLIN